MNVGAAACPARQAAMIERDKSAHGLTVCTSQSLPLEGKPSLRSTEPVTQKKALSCLQRVARRKP